MGMAASQARLLSITTRLSDNELRSQLINNSKMRLATESSQVSEAYIDALNNTTYMFTNYDADNKATYQNLTFNSLTAYNEFNNQYGLSNAAGQILVSEKDAANFEGCNGDLAAFLECYGLEYKTTYFDRLAENYSNSGGYVLLDGTDPATYSLFTAENLKTMYEGGTDSAREEWAGYDASLMSAEFNNYITLQSNYENAKDNYNNIMTSIIKEYLYGSIDDSGATIKAAVTTDGTHYCLQNIKDFIDSDGDGTSTTSTGTAISNVDTALQAFLALIDKINSDGKFSSNTDYTYDGSSCSFYTYMYNSINDIINMSSNFEGTAELTRETDESTSTTYIYMDLDGDEIRISGSSSSGYTIEVLSYDETNNISEWDTVSATIVGNEYTLEFDETGNGTNDVSYTIDMSNFDDLFTDDSALANGIDYTGKYLTTDYKNEIKLDELSCLVNLFENMFQFVIDSSKFEDEISDSAYYSYYEDYINASKALSEFIFADDVGSNYYAYLDDYTWVVEHGGYDPNNYQSVLNVLALEDVLNVYGDPLYAYIKITDPDANGDAEAQWYTNLFNRMLEGYQVLEKGLASSEEWIKYALESGLVKLEQVDSTNTWNSLTYTSCSDITETTDSLAVTKAEAEYNKAMNKIEAKDKVYDLELKNIDTEHTALETEYDSIKSALDKNVERVFKLYS